MAHQMRDALGRFRRTAARSRTRETARRRCMLGRTADDARRDPVRRGGTVVRVEASELHEFEDGRCVRGSGRREPRRLRVASCAEGTKYDCSDTTSPDTDTAADRVPGTERFPAASCSH
jgi:hypothetical protein